MLEDMVNSLGRPFREPIPLTDLLLFTVIYAIIAYVVFDAVRIVGSYLKSAID